MEIWYAIWCCAGVIWELICTAVHEIKGLDASLYWRWNFGTPACCCGALCWQQTWRRGCTCTIILFRGHSSCILQLLAFHKAKARMNGPASWHRKQKAFGEGRDPQACSNGSECNVQHFIFIYIYIIYTEQQWDPNKCQTSHSTQLQNKDRPTFFNKKKYFALFSVKVQLN